MTSEAAASARFCPRCATPLEWREQAGRRRPVCPACGFVHYQNPAPVAACIAIEGRGLYLIQRRYPPGAGRWALPAGFIEHAERPDEAAMRETLEETGLIVAIQRLVGVYSYIEQNGQRSGVVIVYLARVVGGEPRAGDDAGLVEYFAADALPTDLAFETHQLALRDWLG